MTIRDTVELGYGEADTYSLGAEMAAVKSINHIGCGLLFWHAGHYMTSNATAASVITTTLGVLSLSLLDMRRYQLSLLLATLVAGCLAGAGAFLGALMYLAAKAFGYAINRGIEFKAWKQRGVAHG